MNEWQEKVFHGEAYALPTNVLYYIEGANPRLDAFVRAEESYWNRRLSACNMRLQRVGWTAALWADYLSLRPDIDSASLSKTMPTSAKSPLSGSLLYRVDGIEEEDTYIFRQADLSAASPYELEEILESFLPQTLFDNFYPDMCGSAPLCEAEEMPMKPEESSPLEAEESKIFTLFAPKRKAAGAAQPREEKKSVQEQFLSELEQALSRLSDEGMNIFLQTMGNDFLQSLSNLAPKPLSPILVDKQFRILLPEYDMEIKMNALWKAIYILFLRHPEGIVLKDMPDYRNELSDIYYAMGCGEYERMEATLDDVTTPGSDNFRQYVSKINRAFTAVLAVDLAQHYMITGQRGKPYRIQLENDLRNVSVF